MYSLIQEGVVSVVESDTLEENRVKAYLDALKRDGSTYYIDNVDTQIQILQWGDMILPVTINEREYENSYVCSPYSHYITYAKEELSLLENKMLRIFLRCFLNGLGWYLQRGQINRVVIVNNWLLSTNLYPSLTHVQVEEITEKLVSMYPHHAILFRSINDHVPTDAKQIFEQLGYSGVVSRQVYFYDPFSENTVIPRDLKQDVKLLKKSGYEIVDHFSEDQIPRIVELYNMLYLDKYSLNNPQFNDRFIRLVLRENILTLKGLKKGDQLDGVIGYFTCNGVMTTPVFGYDTTYPPQKGLYRMLSALLVQEAQEHHLLLHQSSGAASFKRLRGAYSAIEYTMVYAKHLPRRRRFPWMFLSRFMEWIAKPLLKRYQL